MSDDANPEGRPEGTPPPPIDGDGALPPRPPTAPPPGSTPGAPPSPAPPPGAPPPVAPPPPSTPAAWTPSPAPAAADTNGVALGAMVIGILSLLLAIIGVFVLPLFLAVPGGIVAIVLGAVGRKRARSGAPRAGQATTGIVTGIVALVVAAIWVSVVVVLGSQFFDEFSGELAELEACIEETGDRDLCSERFSDEVFERLDR